MGAESLLVRVQHHESRAELLDRLLPRLDGLDVEVVTDVRAPIRSPWRCYKECLSRPHDATHVLVLQDDAIPCEGFGECARLAIAAHPDRVIAFFVAGVPRRTAAMVRVAYEEGETFVRFHERDFVPTVATCWPVDQAEYLLRWATPQRVSTGQRGDDKPVGDFVMKTGHRALATVPSLVQHPDDVPSTLDLGSRRHRNGGGRAAHGKNRNRVAALYHDRPDVWLERMAAPMLP